MSSIQQLYCTHCTYGSSALERNAGELADRTLGYSARAGSYEGEHLRQCYRDVERYVYYYPPRDTPSEAKLGLTAATSPQRLMCVPALGERQMLAQVCYRPTDCEGRPGSYFAHVLFRDRQDGQEPWSPLHCARLWGAPGWVQEDSPAIPHRLQSLGTLDALLHGGPPAVDDRTLVSFLNTPAGGAFNDPGGVIPPRWQRLDAVFRRQAFTEAFDALIEIGTLGQPSLLLVIEPGLAALFFYGMLRLLPAGALRDTLSFSTFEPNPDRLCTTLAATWFFDPGHASVPADGFGVRGIVVNTLDNRPAPSPRRQSAYVHAMIDRLLTAGWYSVDGALEDLQAVAARSTDDLERLTAVELMAQALLAGRELLQGLEWRRSPQVVAYLRRSIARELFSRRDIAPTLNKLIGKPAHLIVLELLSGEADDSGARPAVEYLLQRLPDEQFGALVRLDSVPAQFKLDVLARRVTFHGKVPPGCEWLWEDATLLPSLLARLDPDTVERFCRNTGEQYRGAFLAALLQARRLPGPGSKALAPVAELLPPAAVADVYRIAGEAFFAQYPADEPTLGRKLHELLALLPEGGPRFSAWLDAILAGKDHLPSDRDCRAVVCWDACRRAIMEVGSLQTGQGSAFSFTSPDDLETACRKMAEAVAEALPDDAVNDDDEIVGADRLGCLHAVGRELLGGELLPAGVGEHDALWGKMAQYFDGGKWPSASAGKSVPQPPPPPPPPSSMPFSAASHGHKPATKKKAESRKGPYIVAAGVAAVAFVVGALIFAGSRGDGKHGKPEDEQKSPAASKGKTPEEPPPAKTKTREKTTPPQKTPEKTPDEKPGKTPEKTAEEPAKEPPQPPKPKPDEEQKWRQEAWKLAKARNGRLLTKDTMEKGQTPLSAEELEELKNPAELRLAVGRLEVGQESVEFGQDFAVAKPTSRHRIPADIAQKLFGYDSVWVEIRKDTDGFRFVVEPKRFSDDGAELLVLEPVELEAKEHASKQIAARCRSIAAVVYAPAVPIKPKPEHQPGPDVNDPHTQVVQFRPISVAASKEFIARIVLQVRHDKDKVLPAYITKKFLAKCHGQFLSADGKIQVFEMDLIAKPDRDKGPAKGSLPPGTAKIDVPANTVRIRVRFAFYKEIENVMKLELKRLTESGPFVFDVKPGTEYTVRHEVPAQTIEDLKLK